MKLRELMSAHEEKGEILTNFFASIFTFSLLCFESMELCVWEDDERIFLEAIPEHMEDREMI